MKKFLSAILICTLILSAGCMNVFADDVIDGLSELRKYDIMKGDPDGKMRLSDPLSRAEAVTLLVRLYGITPEKSAVAPANIFHDIENHWACNAAMIANHLGIAEGDQEANFRPDEKIAAQEFLKMVICLLGYKEVAEQQGGYPIGYILQASKYGVTNSVPLITDKPVTREQAAKILCNSLDIPLMAMTSFGENNTYTILDGKNGSEYRSLRTMLEAE